MKPNFKKKQQLVKVTYNGQNNNLPKKSQPKLQQQQELPSLDQSLVGQRHFIYFDNKSINPSQVQNNIQQNISLAGSTQKVFFTNASVMNRQQLEKDKKLYQQINAFKPSQKLVRQSNQNNFKKNKNDQKYNLKNSQLIEQDDNEFLQLHQVGKWQKGNKSTVISEQMKKMNTQLQNRLTQTKWAKKKPLNSQEQNRAKTQKNRSISKNQSIKIKQNKQISQFTNNQSKNLSQLTKKQLKQNQNLNFKKQTEKLLNDIGPQNQSKLSSMTSWKEPEKKQQYIQEEENNEQQEQEEQEDQQQEQQDQQSSQEQQSEEQQQDEEGEEDSDESSGQQGWDQPQQQTPQDQQLEEEEKQDLFEVPEQKPQLIQIKAKKWGSSRAQSQINDSKTLRSTQKCPQNNPSIKIENKKIQQTANQHQQIQDLTQGQIQNQQLDPNWQKLEKILLRIQKLVN